MIPLLVLLAVVSIAAGVVVIVRTQPSAPPAGSADEQVAELRAAIREVTVAARRANETADRLERSKHKED